MDRSRGETARMDGRLAPLIGVTGRLVNVPGISLGTRLRKCPGGGGWRTRGADRRQTSRTSGSDGDTHYGGKRKQVCTWGMVCVAGDRGQVQSRQKEQPVQRP